MKEMMTNEVTINPVRAQYSILVLDKAIIVCFLIHQNIMTIATDQGVAKASLGWAIAQGLFFSFFIYLYFLFIKK